MNKINVFIPIKTESQRVPYKNFRAFGGYPLWQYTVNKYVSLQIPVFIDTDSPEIIAAVKMLYGCDKVCAYLRKKHLLGHNISVNQLIEDFFVRGHGKNKTIAQIHVTNPFLQAETVLQASNKLFESDSSDSVVSCDYIQARAWIQTNQEKCYCAINHIPAELIQTQKLVPIIVENSCFYIFTFNSFKNKKNRVGQDPFFYRVNWPENLDIDTEEDWIIARKTYSILN